MSNADVRCGKVHRIHIVFKEHTESISAIAKGSPDNNLRDWCDGRHMKGITDDV